VCVGASLDDARKVAGDQPIPGRRQAAPLRL